MNTKPVLSNCFCGHDHPILEQSVEIEGYRVRCPKCGFGNKGSFVDNIHVAINAWNAHQITREEESLGPRIDRYIHIRKDQAELFENYLRRNGIEFEPSEDSGYIHFIVSMNKKEAWLARNFISEYMS